jgi:predicted TIM-barrel fold metal-dependent hydrolase
LSANGGKEILPPVLPQIHHEGASVTDPSLSRTGSSPRDREKLRDKAATFFKEKANRNVATYQQMETDRLIGETKIAKLRTLRLAKEDADREVARLALANQPIVVKKKKSAAIKAN